VDNLLSRIAEMSHRLQPTFVTLTWKSTFTVRVRSERAVEPPAAA
jgi:hypothetical protein